MANIARRSPSRAARRPISRPVQRAIDAEHGDALVEAAAVEKIAYVAVIGLNYTAMLSRDEELANDQAPHGAARHAAIVDAAASGIAHRVHRLALER